MTTPLSPIEQAALEIRHRGQGAAEHATVAYYVERHCNVTFRFHLEEALAQADKLTAAAETLRALLAEAVKEAA